MNWEQSVLTTLDSCIKAATEYPNDIVEIFHYATVEGTIDDCELVKALVQCSAFDVNHVDIWPNSNLVKTSLLLSSIEFQNDKMVNVLLELGANHNMVDERGFGVLDLILWGHQYEPTKCIRSLQKLQSQDIAYTLQSSTINELRTIWFDYLLSKPLMSELHRLLGENLIF